MRTELVFILDRSGSMSGLEGDTIGGYNGLLAKQKEEEGECTVTTVLFDDRYELLHDRIPLQGVRPLTRREYYVRGCTALLDAMGRTIEKIAAVQRNTAPEVRAEKVLFVITTDGMENASREFRTYQIRDLVERQKKEFGWEFLFLGANIDAIAAAGELGIAPERAVDFHADSEGTRISYETVCAAVSEVRAGHALPREWKAEIEHDHQSRPCRR